MSEEARETIEKSEAYQARLRHRRECPGWAKGNPCIDCGYDLVRFGVGLLDELEWGVERRSLDAVYDEVVAFNDEFFPGWRSVRSNDLRLTMNAMAGEAGEGMQEVLAVLVAESALNGQVGKLCDLVKHLYGGGTNDKGATFVDVAEEGVDVFFYLVLLFGALGAEREAFVAFVEKKLAKVRRRMEERGGHGRTA